MISSRRRVNTIQLRFQPLQHLKLLLQARMVKVRRLLPVLLTQRLRKYTSQAIQWQNNLSTTRNEYLVEPQKLVSLFVTSIYVTAIVPNRLLQYLNICVHSTICRHDTLYVLIVNKSVHIQTVKMHNTWSRSPMNRRPKLNLTWYSLHSTCCKGPLSFICHH